LVRIMDHKSRPKKIQSELWITNPANFQKFWPDFANPVDPHKSLVL
jgi:hypothetical protein